MFLGGHKVAKILYIGLPIVTMVNSPIVTMVNKKLDHMLNNGYIQCN